MLKHDSNNLKNRKNLNIATQNLLSDIDCCRDEIMYTNWSYANEYKRHLLEKRMNNNIEKLTQQGLSVQEIFSFLKIPF